MELSLTQAQKNFVHGLKLFGCSKLQTIIMGLEMWHPDDLEEMLDYMVDHLDATPEQLYEKCLQIAAKREDPPPYPDE
jgi:hypothetical protein